MHISPHTGCRMGGFSYHWVEPLHLSYYYKSRGCKGSFHLVVSMSIMNQRHIQEREPFPWEPSVGVGHNFTTYNFFLVPKRAEMGTGREFEEAGKSQSK